MHNPESDSSFEKEIRKKYAILTEKKVAICKNNLIRQFLGLNKFCHNVMVGFIAHVLIELWRPITFEPIT